MKVEKINLTNYNSAQKPHVTKGLQPPNTYSENQNFTGGIPQADLVKDIQKLMPRTIRVTNKLADNMGEIQNILINAAGTGLIAPIFIKYNPLSKTDEDTRTYSAWRQPLSAVLAVATQVSMVAPFNNLIKWMSNVGKLPEPYNKTNFQDDTYIMKILKKTNPHLSPEQLDIAVKAEQNKQYNELLENLNKKNAIFIKQYKSEIKKMDDSTYKNLLIKTIESMIKDDNKKLKNCGTTRQKREIRSEYLRSHNNFARDVLTDIDKNLKDINKLPDSRDYLSDKIKALKSANADSELINMVDEVLQRAKIKPQDEQGEKALMNEMKNKVTKMLNHVNTYANVLSEQEVAKHVEDSVKSTQTALETSIDTLTKLKSNLSTSDMSIKEIQKKLEDVIKNNKITEDCSIKSSFATKVIEKYKSDVENSIKGYKQFTGLIISLAVLPVSCYLLNWIYPIFMDALFPNLSNKKHDNEASALVAKAPKKEEV